MLIKMGQILVQIINQSPRNSPVASFSRGVESAPGLTRQAASAATAGQHIAVVVGAPALVILDKVLFDVTAHIRTFDTIPDVTVAFGVKENDIMNRAEASALAMRSGSSPDNLASEVGNS